MAEVIREGGRHPLKVNGWADYVKLVILERLYDDFGTMRVINIKNELMRTDVHGWIAEHHSHNLRTADIENALREMHRDNWIEPEEYKCECCKGNQHPWQEILKHVDSFKLTEKGRELIPEHIFP